MPRSSTAIAKKPAREVGRERWERRWRAHLKWKERVRLRKQQEEDQYFRSVPAEVKLGLLESCAAFSAGEIGKLFDDELTIARELCSAHSDPLAAAHLRRLEKIQIEAWSAIKEFRSFRTMIGLPGYPREKRKAKLEELSHISRGDAKDEHRWAQWVHALLEQDPRLSLEAAAEIVAAKYPVEPVYKTSGKDPFGAAVRRVKNAYNAWLAAAAATTREQRAMVGDTGRKLTIRPRTPCLVVRDPLTRKALPPVAGTEVRDTAYWRARLADGDVVTLD